MVTCWSSVADRAVVSGTKGDLGEIASKQLQDLWPSILIMYNTGINYV
jgi:hypothetical protein